MGHAMVKEKPSFLRKRMTKEEKGLLKTINKRLAETGLHLRLMSLNINSDGSISTEFVPPIHKWIEEDISATAIIEEEIIKYQSR